MGWEEIKLLKKFEFFLILIVVLFCGCSEKFTVPIESEESFFIGRWKCRYEQAIILIFENDTHGEIYNNPNIVKFKYYLEAETITILTDFGTYEIYYNVINENEMVFTSDLTGGRTLNYNKET